MTTLTVYGEVKASRAWWTDWTCRELDLEYDNVSVGFLEPDIKRDDYLALNPNGLIPTITDGDFALWESMAINLYLAKKYGNDSLYPTSLEGEALTWQWSFWIVTRVEVPLLTLMVASMNLPAGSDLEQYFLKHVPAWTPDELNRCRSVLQGPFGVLDGELGKRPYLLGDTFTVADLNVSAILARNSGSVLQSGGSEALIELSSIPHMVNWLHRCFSRSACPRRETLTASLETARRSIDV